MATGPGGAVRTVAWTREHVALLDRTGETFGALDVLGDADVRPLLPGVDFWDLWPVRRPDGAVADVCGRAVWAGLSAPAYGHPGARHDSARIRLVLREPDAVDGTGWSDLGPLFPEGASAGSREWAGSLVLDGSTLRAAYTAAGVRGETSRSFRQRIMGAEAELTCTGARPVVTGWGPHRELVTADGVRYVPAREATGEPGFIKAFRDPSPVVDPATGEGYLLFTGSDARAADPDFNGCVGVARAVEGADPPYELLDPLLTADGVNNELERPHVVWRDGLVYLFASTQRRTFHPDVPGPTGLYGFVATGLLGPYAPLNGSGLVLRNPAAEPTQAYSWLVLPDLTCSGFVDSYAMRGTGPDELEAQGAEAVRRHFGGTMTPVVRLELDGDRAWVEAQGVPLSDP